MHKGVHKGQTIITKSCNLCLMYLTFTTLTLINYYQVFAIILLAINQTDEMFYITFIIVLLVISSRSITVLIMTLNKNK